MVLVIYFSPNRWHKESTNIVAKGQTDAEEIDLIKEPDKLMKVNFGKRVTCVWLLFRPTAGVFLRL